MKDLFLAITAQLETRPELLWIDDDFGQLDQYSIRPAVTFPAALVSISYPQTQDVNEAIDLNQVVNAQVIVRLAFEPMGETYSAAPDVVRQQALQRYDIAQTVYETMQGFSAGNKIQPLTRTSQISEVRRDKYKVIRFVFATQFME